MKTREQIFSQVYLNKRDIGILLQLDRNRASNVFNLARDIETGFRPYETKVKLKSVLEVTGIPFSQLEKQLKKA